MANKLGRPTCPACHGAGIVQTRKGPRPCGCRRPTVAEAEQLRAANARDDLPGGRWAELFGRAGARSPRR